MATRQPPTLAEVLRQTMVQDPAKKQQAYRPAIKPWTGDRSGDVGVLPIVLSIAGWIVLALCLLGGVMTVNFILPVAGVISCVTFCSMGSIIRSIRHTEADAANALSLIKYVADAIETENLNK